MMPDRIATARTLLICLLALAVLGFRAPVADPSGLPQVAAMASGHAGHAHDLDGHSHEDEDDRNATYGHDHDHDRFHVGDHSHDTPAEAALIGFRFESPTDSDREIPDDRLDSRRIPPRDRPPRLT